MKDHVQPDAEIWVVHFSTELRNKSICEASVQACSAAQILFAEHVERCSNMLEHDLVLDTILVETMEKCWKSTKVVCCQTSAERPWQFGSSHLVAKHEIEAKLT